MCFDGNINISKRGILNIATHVAVNQAIPVIGLLLDGHFSLPRSTLFTRIRSYGCIRTAREFFKIDAQRVMSALRISNGTEVTPRQDIGEDQEAVAVYEYL
jgi:hypothetical protein